MYTKWAKIRKNAKTKKKIVILSKLHNNIGLNIQKNGYFGQGKKIRKKSRNITKKEEKKVAVKM